MTGSNTSEWIWTILIAVVGLAIVGWANWRERRPYEPGRHGLFSPGLLQFVGLVVLIVALAHMLTLWTGTPFKGRLGR